MQPTFATVGRHLAERHRKRDEQRECERMRVRTSLERSLPEIARRCGLTRAILFGSLAWGGFEERSDVDLLVWGIRGAALDDLGAELSEIVQRSVHVVAAREAPSELVRSAEEDGEELSVA